MIVSAAVFRIDGFIRKESGELKNEFQEGLLALCCSERGKPVILKFASNKKDATVADFNNYLISKRNGLVKSKEIDSVAGELEYVEDISLEIESALEEFKSVNPGVDRKVVMTEKKRLTQEKAEEIVYTRRTIGPGTVIRAVVSIPDAGKKYEMYNFNGVNIPVIESRSIIYDNEGNPSSSGFYLFSQMSNAFPVTISPAFNKDNEPLGFFVMRLSRLARLDHFELLVGHIKRSIDKQLIDEQKAYIPRISSDYEQVKLNSELRDVLKELYEFSKEKSITVDNSELFFSVFDRFVGMVVSDSKILRFVQIEFNLILSPKLIEGAMDKVSPFTQLPKSMVSLNMSKQNPDVKEAKRLEILNVLKEMAAGNIPSELNCIYHTPALKLSEEPTSWGFMENNIQVENLVLSMADTVKLI